MSETTNPSFKEAKYIPDLRQKYLDSILEQNPSDSVGRIIYNPQRTESDSRIRFLMATNSITVEDAGYLMRKTKEFGDIACVLTPWNMLGNGENQDIYVNAEAFQNLTEDQLVRTITDHEYTHAHDMKHGIDIVGEYVLTTKDIEQIQPETLANMFELRAHLTVMTGLHKKNMLVTPEFSATFKSVLNYGAKLMIANPKSQFEKLVKDKQLALIDNTIESLGIQMGNLN
ncbi:hypothetical protein HOK51_04840 [Candidatus Woesearchaeota archaeon]|jgi:hypothetical protein|nr:hypothetical protein [Candidatus Woesearchaeota archaeon]MBT6519152.1 hypothetical protein [Candidatus Woesearchaeota archaeon]MBT7367797.1 hypothetical protein [Candidatus Woesearchaeota archaeon]